MNKFLYEDGNKADMKIDEGDRPVYYYILYGTPSDHPVVQQAMELSGNQLTTDARIIYFKHDEITKPDMFSPKILGTKKRILD